jgi:hypothetical protein
VRRWIIIANLVGLVLLGLLFGLAVLLEDEREVDQVGLGAVTASHQEDLLAASGPLLNYEDPYLRGRGDWFRARYAGLRQELEKLEIPDEGLYETKVLRSAVTEGPWLAILSQEDQERRKVAEGQVVEAQAVFTLPGIKPLDALSFLICSDFKAQIPSDAMDHIGQVFPGSRSSAELENSCLDEPPELKPNQVLTHEVWKPALLRKGTDIWFINELRREGDCMFFIYRLVKSCQPSDSYTQVRLATGQYAVVPTESGCAVLLKSYYNGQAIPGGFDFVVRNRTNSFYKGIAQFLAEKIPAWQPSESAREWIKGIGIED